MDTKPPLATRLISSILCGALLLTCPGPAAYAAVGQVVSIKVNAPVNAPAGAGLLKTSASAGIPGYVDSYLHAEQLTLRRKALTTEEVANAAVFLLDETRLCQLVQLTVDGHIGNVKNLH